MFGIPAMASGLPSAMQTGGPLAITTHTPRTLVAENFFDETIDWQWAGKNPPKWVIVGSTAETGPFFPFYEQPGSSRAQNIDTTHFQWWRVVGADAHGNQTGPTSNTVYLQYTPL